MSCSNLPAGATCIFAPGTITPGSQPVSVTLTVATSSTTAALHRNGKAPLLALWLPGALGLVMLPAVRRRYRRAALLPLVFGLVLLQLACGAGPTKTSVGQSASAATMTSGTYSITVAATSPSVSRSTQVTLTVN